MFVLKTIEINGAILYISLLPSGRFNYSPKLKNAHVFHTATDALTAVQIRQRVCGTSEPLTLQLIEIEYAPAQYKEIRTL
jgi:hypothetical protein